MSVGHWNGYSSSLCLNIPVCHTMDKFIGTGTVTLYVVHENMNRGDKKPEKPWENHGDRYSGSLPLILGELDSRNDPVSSPYLVGRTRQSKRPRVRRVSGRPRVRLSGKPDSRNVPVSGSLFYFDLIVDYPNFIFNKEFNRPR